MKIPEPPAGTRGMFDPEQTRKNVFDYTKDAFFTKLNSLETNNYKLRVSELHYPEKRVSLKEQKQAILEKKDVTVPLKGKFELIRKDSGEVVAEKSTIIAHVPYITERNTSIINGSEYLGIMQERLKPGIYTRIKGSGESEAHINVIPTAGMVGKAMGGRIIFYPEKQLFIYRIQNTQIPLYGILKDMGLSDDSMQQVWGADVLRRNKASYTGTEIDKLYDKVFV